MSDKLYFVIPCYNEEEVLPETARRLQEKMHALIKSGRISPDSKVVFVNDGSGDRTWEIIRNLHERDSLFSGVNLSRNRGHQNALLAGLMTVHLRNITKGRILSTVCAPPEKQIPGSKERPRNAFTA